MKNNCKSTILFQPNLSIRKGLKLKMKNILKIVFVLIGAIIGAGFASGKEIYIFFFSYGLKGIAGIIISIALMGIIIYYSLNIIVKNKITTYKEFLNNIFSKKKNSKLKDIVNIIINIFIIISFYIMIAGFGAYFEEQFSINKIIGSIILAIFCYLILRKSTKGLIEISQILVPFLIIFILIIGILNILNIDFSNLKNYIIENNNTNWLISAILYSSYNSILLIPVLITLNNSIEKEKNIKYIAIFTTLIITILSILLFLILTRVDVNISKLEMPAVYVISRIYPFLKMIYGAVLLASILTTAISLGNSIIQNVQKNKNIANLTLCITAILVSNFGFSNLVNTLYPLFGYLGIIQIIGICCYNSQRI